jgi:hypothetical protein
MQHRNRWLVVTLISAGVVLAACRPTGQASSESPVSIQPGPGGLNRVVLTDKAAQRIAVQTAPVREEQIMRTRTVGAEVVGPGAADPSRAAVRLLLNESEVPNIDRSKPARILSLGGGSSSQPIGTAVAVQAPGVASGPSADKSLYYAVDGPGQGLAAGQRVLVEVALAGNGSRKVVPSSAVVYDTKGKGWVYTNPEPRAFVRHPVTVEYYDDSGRAILSEGPSAGTPVVTVGAAELLGAEIGVGR